MLVSSGDPGGQLASYNASALPQTSANRQGSLVPAAGFPKDEKGCHSKMNAEMSPRTTVVPLRLVTSHHRQNERLSLTLIKFQTQTAPFLGSAIGHAGLT